FACSSDRASPPSERLTCGRSIRTTSPGVALTCQITAPVGTAYLRSRPSASTTHNWLPGRARFENCKPAATTGHTSSAVRYSGHLANVALTAGQVLALSRRLSLKPLNTLASTQSLLARLRRST